jgi:hypothetical protein
MRKLVVLLSIAFALAACAVTRDPTKVDFPDDAGQGLVLLKAGSAPIRYTLNVVEYDEVEQAIDVDTRRGFTVGGSANPAYVALLLRPGTYVFQDIVQQGSWAVCFNEGTRSFSIKAGEALFLGDLNPVPHLAQLQHLALESGQTEARTGDTYHYFDNIVPPQVTMPSPDSMDFRAAKAFESSAMPMLHGRLKPALYKSARFGTGYTLFGISRVCGGLYKDKVGKG